jgi:hypothetical protein
MTDITEIAGSLRDLDAVAAKAAAAVNVAVQLGPAALGHDTFHLLHVLQLRTGEFRHALSTALARLPAPALAEPAEVPPAKSRRR